MTIAVPLEELRGELESRGPSGYLLTAGPDGRPHCVAVEAAFSGDEIAMGAGNTSVRNAEDRRLVALLFPPPAEGGYSLIVDGEVTSAVVAEDEGNSLSIRPSKAVLHRPGPAEGGGASVTGCGNDCVPVYSETGSTRAES
ncbi:MAG: pyridoxamine 5'-phosphate oxidase family protein [Acidimicrobiales bacterium]